MIEFYEQRGLRWYFGEAQVLFERSPVTAMMERQNTFAAGAIRDAGLFYGKPGRALVRSVGGEDVFTDELGPGTRYVNTRDPVHSSAGKVIGYLDPAVVQVTGDTQGGPAPTPDEADDHDDDISRYGRYSRRVLAVSRKDVSLANALEAYFGPLGETWEAGILVAEEVKKEKKAKKKRNKPELTTGIEVRERVETEVVQVRRKGPGRIAALYHLTAAGRELLQREAKSTAQAHAAPAMRALVTSPRPDDPLYQASMERIRSEAVELLARASQAYTEAMLELRASGAERAA